MLYILPCSISDNALDSLSASSINVIRTLKYFIVERARTSRRFIKQLNHPLAIDQLNFIEIDKRDPSYLTEVKVWFDNQYDIGLLSESGMPAIADPGADIVAQAHKANVIVKPISGPSSIIMALSASGFNGQNFRFNGYPPIKEPELKNKLLECELAVLKRNETQIFIETPYRNDRLLKFILKHCSSNIKLSICRDLSGENERVISYSLSNWKKQRISIGKFPTVFLLGK